MNQALFNRKPAAAVKSQRGVTLVETSVVASVLAVVAGLVAPQFDELRQRKQLEGAAAQLEADVHHTRMLAVARNAPLRISFEAGAAGSCYVIHTGAAQQCRCVEDGQAVCQGNAQAERVVYFGAGSSISLSSNSRSVLFDPMRGTSSPTATVQLRAQGGAAIQQVLNIMGRVRSCSPAPTLSGYPRC
jgi:type IV fimbrial biogenesis protein FimT